jgi:valyl-tRNA synthetase
VSRFAARAAAHRLLDAEGALSAVEAAPEYARRCRWCGTVLVPIRIHAWFLQVGQLEIDAADAVRNGTIAIDPASCTDLLLDAAGRDPLWCVTTELPAASTAPIALCQDCAQAAVSLDPSSSCRKCMGPMEAGSVALSARFTAAMWGVVQAGAEGEVWAVCPPTELAPWCMRTIALGLFLTGRCVVDRVVVSSESAE